MNPVSVCSGHTHQHEVQFVSAQPLENHQFSDNMSKFTPEADYHTLDIFLFLKKHMVCIEIPGHFAAYLRAESERDGV